MDWKDPPQSQSWQVTKRLLDSESAQARKVSEGDGAKRQAGFEGISSIKPHRRSFYVSSVNPNFTYGNIEYVHSLLVA